jgi:hypothetical protein
VNALKIIAAHICMWLILPLIVVIFYGLFSGLFALVNWTQTSGYSPGSVLLGALACLCVVAGIATGAWHLWEERPSMRAAKAAMAEAAIFPLGRLAKDDEDEECLDDIDDTGTDGGTDTTSEGEQK